MWNAFFAMCQGLTRFLARHISGYGLRRYYPVKILYASATNFLMALMNRFDLAYTEVHGQKMFLNPKDQMISAEIYFRGSYEPFETEVVAREIRRGDVVLDLGANIGYYTLLFSRLVGDGGRVYAFEPDPENFSYLKRSVEVNSCRNVILENKAVSNETGKTLLYRSADNLGDHVIFPVGCREAVEVETVRLDDYFGPSFERVDFIKMDIQGSEVAAFRGMGSLLQRSEGVKIITEFWPAALRRFGTEPETFLRLLRDGGFCLYEVNAAAKKVRPVSTEDLLKNHIPEEEDSTNLLCVKSGRPAFLDSAREGSSEGEGPGG